MAAYPDLEARTQALKPEVWKRETQRERERARARARERERERERGQGWRGRPKWREG